MKKEIGYVSLTLFLAIIAGLIVYKLLNLNMGSIMFIKKTWWIIIPIMISYVGIRIGLGKDDERKTF